MTARTRTIDACNRSVADEMRGLDDAELYTRLGHIITPEIKALADAQWAAMDCEGRLPQGWEYKPEVSR